MKKLTFILLVFLCVSAQGQWRGSIRPNQLPAADTLDGTEIIMYWQDSKSVQTTLSVTKDYIIGKYYYKTIHVDSAKIRERFDTTFIAKPGTDSIIVIDEMLITHDGALNYDTMVCFMVYPDTVLGTWSSNNLYRKQLFWQTKSDTIHSQESYQRIFPVWDQIACKACTGANNWTVTNTPQYSRSYFSNKAMKFLAGDYYYYNGHHNALGRRAFTFKIKYHYEIL